MANLQIRIDDKLRDEAQKVANSLGMDLPTAVRIFLSQMVNDNGLPFRPGRSEALAYDQWFREQVQASIDDPRPSLSDEDVKKSTAARHARLQQLIK